jgi:hypothetical protein
METPGKRTELWSVDRMMAEPLVLGSVQLLVMVFVQQPEQELVSVSLYLLAPVWAIELQLEIVRNDKDKKSE